MGIVSLVEIEDGDFDWFSGTRMATRSDLTLASGGIDHPDILDIVRNLTKQLHSGGCRSSWMIVFAGEVVGLCSFRDVPALGYVEIGYGIAESCRERGHATAAVAAIIEKASHNADLNFLTAETSVSNPTSGRVLEKNGFSRKGMRVDPEDGEVVQWERPL